MQFALLSATTYTTGGLDMSLESYRIACWSLLLALGISIFNHYFTGKSYTETCNQVYYAVGDDLNRFEQVLGKTLSQECLNRMS